MKFESFKKFKKILVEHFDYQKNHALITNRHRIIAENRKHLKNIVEEEIKLYGDRCDLNHIDTYQVTDMSELFYYSSFNGDISRWDVSNVIDMESMFKESRFNGNISKWDVSKVKTMESMFYASYFNGDISMWNVSKVLDMRSMFKNSDFNKDISKWDVSNVEEMSYMFENSRFNGDISDWNVSNLKNARYMFSISAFTGDISKWDVRELIDIYMIFSDGSDDDNSIFKLFCHDLTENKNTTFNFNIPYWAKYEDYDARKKAINAYFLSKELSQELIGHSKSIRKIKI